eukprot:comp15705_c0_seq1/m.24239 comp15705_c0_seq1/g.24239  ORF comp15705_c0_seq1/g.24239 comp15705_c0_seq1/m.24239 type:complete len:125 (+) comp15705_c0_seq1:32-406(+)
MLRSLTQQNPGLGMLAARRFSKLHAPTAKPEPPVVEQPESPYDSAGQRPGKQQSWASLAGGAVVLLLLMPLGFTMVSVFGASDAEMKGRSVDSAQLRRGINASDADKQKVALLERMKDIRDGRT